MRIRMEVYCGEGVDCTKENVRWRVENVRIPAQSIVWAREFNLELDGKEFPTLLHLSNGHQLGISLTLDRVRGLFWRD